YDVRDNDAGETWVIMEYLRGPTLDQVLERSPHGLRPEEVTLWFSGLAASVEALHQRGIVHRDLKPANAFRDGDQVKLGDYGLSKFISVSQRGAQTQSIGTVHYMAPEISRGRYGKEIDIYALGVMLHEMLTGKVPFDGESIEEILMKHLTQQPDLHRLAEPYRAVVKKCLEKDPENRYSSVKELMDALNGVGTAASASAPEDDVLYIKDEEEPLYIGPDPEPQAAGGGDILFLNEEPARSPRGPARPVHYIGPSAGDHGSSWYSPEPIAAAMGGFLGHLGTNPAALILFLVAFFVSFLYLWPGYLFALWVYAVYYGVRVVVLGLAAACGSPSAHTAGNAPASKRRASFCTRKRETRVLPKKTFLEKATELSGSLVVSALAVVVCCVLFVGAASQAPEIAGLMNNTAYLQQPGSSTAVAPLENVVMLCLIGIAGAWAILIPAKFWEGRSGDGLQRRFVMMIVGLAVGALAYAADVALMINFTEISPSWNSVWEQLKTPTLQGPTLLSYMAFFGVLFFTVRWWLQADPLRSSRLSFLPLVVCGFWAFMLFLLWPFTQSWGILWAVVISLAVQSAAPWVAPKPSPDPANENEAAVA
ncbi:MAG: serine/threonine protein kinase, partial [Planctomycetales bacterium]